MPPPEQPQMQPEMQPEIENQYDGPQIEYTPPPPQLGGQFNPQQTEEFYEMNSGSCGARVGSESGFLIEPFELEQHSMPAAY